MPSKQYEFLISSDWNQCLAPCGPFDVITYHYPQLASRIGVLFERYTGNIISLAEASQDIAALLPAPISRDQMDAYLDGAFCTYSGVVELMQWCRAHQVLFMINTTGMIGYFQRVLAKGLLPTVHVLSASSTIRFDCRPSDPEIILPLFETSDKGRHSETAARNFGIDPRKILIIGDSGGDGPHFVWGAGVGATLLGSMTKPSLPAYCRDHGIAIDHFFGHTYVQGEPRRPEKECMFDFLGLKDLILSLKARKR